MNNKKLVIVLDGISENEYPTSLQLANTPNLDYLCSHAFCCQSEFVDTNFSVGSDVANMCILGYNPKLNFYGRAGIEAAYLKQKYAYKYVYRFNFVTLDNDVIQDFTSGIKTQEQGQICFDKLKDLTLDDHEIAYIDKYHHLIFSNDELILDLKPPHEIMQQSIQESLKIKHPLITLMKASKQVLKDSQSDMIYIWSCSKMVKLKPFNQVFDCKGALISATPLILGLANLSSLDVLDVKNIDGSDKSNFNNKIESAIQALNSDYDYVFVHIEACDYISHLGDKDLKIKTIEKIDQALKPLIKLDDVDILVCSDHHALCSTKAHARGAVPVFIYNKKQNIQNNIQSYNEKNFKDLDFIKPLCLINDFMKG